MTFIKAFEGKTLVPEGTVSDVSSLTISQTCVVISPWRQS